MSKEIERHREALGADPTNIAAFDALEEHYFLAGEWDALVALYEQRLAAPDFEEKPASAVPVIFRLAQVLEERCLDGERAIECYWRVAKLDPMHRPALRQLREIHASRSQWDLVLQIAEIEGQVPMQPFEMAAFQTEMGRIWLDHLEDPGEGLASFKRALEADPQHQSALEGLARCYQAFGRAADAAGVWETLVERLRGPDRAPALLALGALFEGPLDQPDRAEECYRRALTDDPRNQAAVDALVGLAQSLEHWSLLGDLLERRFDLAAGARRRSAIALEAGQLHLAHLDDPQAARMWITRALELCPEDVAVHHAMVDLERRSGNIEPMRESLRRVIELAEGAVPASLLMEAATLESDHGDHERALAYLSEAQKRSPDDPLVLDAFSEALKRLQRWSELAEILERRSALASDDPVVQAEILCELGHVYADAMADAQASCDAYSRAFLVSPEAPGLAARLERLYRKTENWSALRELLERAQDSGPEAERCGFACSLGELLVEPVGDVPAARAAFERALVIDSAAHRALQGLARLAATSGDDDALLEAYEREARVTSDRTRLSFLVWELVGLLEERERDTDALGWIEQLVRSTPEDRTALECASRLQQKVGHHEDLLATLERLNSLLPATDQAANHRRIAWLHLEADRIDQSVVAFESALEMSASDLDSLQALAPHYRAAHRLEDLARVQRRMADLLPPLESAACLEELAQILEEQLGDLDAAIVVLWRLAALEQPARPIDVGTRLESLLERAGRFEELAQQLLERRRSVSDDSEEAHEIDLRRARLLVDPLGQFDEAVAMFRAVRLRHPECREAGEGLERALRAANDSTGLVELLEERATRETDPSLRARASFERAVLLEEALGESATARDAYATLAADPGDVSVATEASVRLERLLERSGDWPALRTQLEAALGRGSEDEDLELHERLAALCRDRLADREGCIDHLEAAGRLRPERTQIWRNLSLLYQECDRTDDWLRVMEAELASRPDDERQHELRVQIARLCAAGERDLDRAREHYEELLLLEPSHSEAIEFLIDHYEASGQMVDVVRMLEVRLAAAEDPGLGERDPTLATSLRIRIAEICAGPLDDLARAIDVLEWALDDERLEPVLVEPLADLYQRTGRRQELVRLCEGASASVENAAERARWLVRLGDAWREGRSPEDLREAAGAYRRALDAKPEEREVESVLREIYRELGEAGPLAELLEREVDRANAASAVPLRLELADLYTESLNRPEDALAELRLVLEVETDHAPARDRAFALAEELGLHSDRLALIDSRLEQPLSRQERTELLERRADLLAGPLDAPADAVAAYRDALALQPDRAGARRSLRRVLESLERWAAVLDCLFLEARSADPDERGAIFERAAKIAGERLSADASLPWLERLRAERPRDPSVPSRIADVHRQAGRPEALLRALEDELSLTSDVSRRRDLQFDRSRVLERDMGSPTRAITALEAALVISANDPEVLKELDRLYSETGRIAERTGVLELRIAASEPHERTALHQLAATLYSKKLAKPEQAVPHLLCALDTNRDTGRTPLGPGERRQALAELGAALLESGRVGAWARAAEAELALLDLEDDAPRVADLHCRLAMAYDTELGRPTDALDHLRALLPLDAAGSATQLDDHTLDRVESALIEQLRIQRNSLELARRLERRLERLGDGAGETDHWLELAQLRSEVLHAPAAALEAFRVVIERRSDSLAAVRGLRGSAECLGEWSQVARGLELELELAGLDARRRSDLQLRLATVCWHRMRDEERAAKAYADVLDGDPENLTALRSLATLCQELERWNEAVDLHEREVAALGDDEPQRSHELWLKVAEVAGDRCGDSERAVRAYATAAQIAPLSLPTRRRWAELHRERGEHPEFVEVFSIWCDDADSGADARDHLRLAETLRALDRRDEALERAERAVEVDDGQAAAWDLLSDLHRERGSESDTARCLERAAECLGGSEGAERLQRAASVIEACDPTRAAELIRRAAQYDAGSATIQAQLAQSEERLEQWASAEAAAGAALDLAAAGGSLDDEGVRSAAMVGGRAARQQDKLEAATRFFAAALERAPENIAALEAQADILFQQGDWTNAREVLERRLDLPTDSGSGAAQRAMLGECLEHGGNPEAALQSLDDALAEDPNLEAAHAARVRIHEAAGSAERATSALEAWAAGSQDPRHRADHLVHAAQIDQNHQHDEAAERHLREALEIDPDHGPAAEFLTHLLWNSERPDEALAAASASLERDIDTGCHAALSLIRGRVLDSQGSERDAADAYSDAARGDPRCVEAALARARLLRSLGEWGDASEALSRFVERHPEPADPAMSEIHHELGRLRAGPLEDMAGAIEAYEKAVALAPTLTRSRQPLARLLAHFPERWSEAVEQHRALLGEDPTRATSLRSLVEIAQQRGAQTSTDLGLTLLRALGIASPQEAAVAPAEFAIATATGARMVDETREQLRRLAVQAHQELADSGLSAGSPREPAEAAESEGYLQLLEATEAELSAPALVGMTADEIGAALTSLATIVLDSERSSDPAPIEAAVESQVGRWARRKLRKTLEGCDPASIAEVDFTAWQRELRVLAASTALDRSNGALRPALVALCEADPTQLSETSDLTPLLAEHPIALGLLARVTDSWCAALANGD